MEVYLRNQEYKVVNLSELINWNSANVIASYGPPAFNSKPRQRTRDGEAARSAKTSRLKRSCKSP